MSEVKNLEVQEALDNSAEIMGKAKGFWERYSKLIIYIGGAVIILIGGWYGYKKFVSEPKEEKANEAIWRAQQYFDKDSLTLALQGDGQNAGFEKIAKNYSGTKAGNLAKYYCGICYLKLNNPTKAVSYLKDFSTDSKSIQAFAYKLLADAYGDLNKNEDAVEYYDKAGHTFQEDKSQSAEALFRAGLKSEIMGKTDKAINYYKEIKEKFSRTDRGFQIDKYLARLGVTE